MLALEGVGKAFPNGTVALRDARLTVESGSVHGLVGANGAQIHHDQDHRVASATTCHKKHPSPSLKPSSKSTDFNQRGSTPGGSSCRWAR
jgi:hypothetical protein